MKNLSFERIKRGIRTRLTLPFYPYLLPFKVRKIRHKPVINVAFILSDISKWKSEALYCNMLEHSRFKPIIAVVPVLTNKDKSLEYLTKQLDIKGYDYIVLSIKDNIVKKTNADIIFYQEPYIPYYYPNHYFTSNLSAVFCYVHYAFHSIAKNYANGMSLLRHCFQVYYENNIAYLDLKKENSQLANNIVVTGLPIMDSFLNFTQSDSINPWNLNDKRKKIIWAPHHTIPGKGSTFISYSTFLDYHETMLKLAHKYKDQVVFAFKPHPMLKNKLLSVWPLEKIENYYKQWESMENTILVNGEYLSLFMNSDAMIHDCSSFQIEYHYTLNPVLYLCRNVDVHEKDLNTFAKKAFECHYIGNNAQDIETFIQNVIKENDPMKNTRKCFYQENLLIPSGKSASDNIINSILNEYI